MIYSKKTRMIHRSIWLLILPVIVIGQIGVTSFPKISFLDP